MLPDFCTHYSFNPTHVFMRQFSTDLYRKLEQEGEHPTGYHRCRGLRLTHDADRIDEFHHGVSVGRQFGIDFEVITPSEAHALFPLMDMGRIKGALYEPTDGYVDPAQTTQAMARLARQGGATILRNSPVQSIRQRSDDSWVVEAPGEEIIAEHVVLAPGFWANQVGKLIGLDLPITPLLHQYLVTEDHPSVAASATDSIPLVRHHDYQWYTRRERDGMVLGAYEQDAQTWSLDGVPDSFGMELMPPDLDRVAHLMEDAMNRMPALAEAGIKSVVHGPVSYCADGQPLIGPAPGLRNAWLACGSGFGIGEGAGAGKLLAEWIVEGQPPMHMGAFDPRRFGSYASGDYRVETAREIFAKQFATHYPFEERESGRGLRKSPLYDTLERNGAQFGNVFGWERPNWFAAGEESHQLSFRRSDWFQAVARECAAVHDHLGIIDLSLFSKFEVSGQGAEQFLDSLSANRLPVKTGEIRLCHFLNLAATIECEFTICRTASDTFYLVCAAAAEQHHMDWLQHHADGDRISIRNLTEQTGILGIAGPNAEKALQTLTDCSLSQDTFPWLTAQNLTLAGIPMRAMRLSYTGEAGFELHMPIQHMESVYQTVRPHGTDFGFYALNAMRTEKGYPAWGVELSVENNPLEIGLSRFVDMNNRDFIGSGTLRSLADHDQARSLRLIMVVADDADLIGGEAIWDGNSQVGVALSGAYGHRTNQSLGFALIDRKSLDGNQLAVDLLEQKRAIKILPSCPFDPDNTLPRQ